RVGILDRKLRIVNAETKTLPDWTEWTLRAVQSVYGYEFQGDNLFLARRNVFDTVVEYFAAKFSCKPTENFWLYVATFISCNIWQMDGLSESYSPPFTESVNIFGGANCKIVNWRTLEVMEFVSLVGGK
ncbi:MAG: restriction endonuclease, partial [Selenomonadaceae bacterium]|nr:restriction endonuclease [Selenomonadaceae bacterium]